MMDLSSLPEAQQQNQDYASQSYYDQTQIQSYDQSYYYYYHQQQQHHHAYYQQSYYSTAYQSLPHQQYPETSTLNPPGVSVSANEAAEIAGPGGAQQARQQHSAYYPAAAPLSQLAQFAGTMQAAEGAMGGMHTPGGQFPNKGGCRQGGRPFQGAGHKNFGPRHSNPATSGRSFRGRGRGRGRGGSRHVLARGASSSSPNPEYTAAEGAELADPSPNATEKAAQFLPEPLLSTTAAGKVEPSQQPLKSAWCELCRVDCTSLQILEQHRNGKRHRKNLLRIEELRKAVKPMAEIQMEQKPIAECQTEASEQPELAQDGEEKEAAVDVPSETVNDEKEIEAEHPGNADDQPEVPVNESSNPQEEKPRMDRFDNWRRGMKRKKRVGQGRKCMKSTFEGSRQSMEPPKPKVVIPLICSLCNVKCDTKEVFGRHLSGKKHIAKLKRFEGHQAMYGPEGVQALYPPNPIVHTLYGSQGSYLQRGAYLPSQTHQAVATSVSTDPQFQHYPMAQAETTVQNGGQNAVTTASEAQH
ncbi:zinc finger protein [Citrus sinensis]|uniref:U1-type domain-containing protein n=1 Tax=Citrus clementina TaxID=85681 RepID=V4TUH0_CITCL|nr:uncharacterized protein LOC18047307 isoform X2 [Citrus x clementina]XP_006477192.2 uncharacterized protein LOC102607541 isoform X3 [Citrus sinensis]ESR53551.1 hypothetical protein CICLE_v10019520mg [Citrus x clementina]KAH9721275.1 zinc finger protein [Citrus sinensis]